MSYLNNTFITLEQAIAAVPAIASEDHLGSDRYKFVSSIEVIKNMQDVGFGLVDVRCPNVRKASIKHVKHEMIFRVESDELGVGLFYEDPRKAAYVAAGDDPKMAVVYPQLRVMNSSDTLCGFKAHMGLFSQVSQTGIMLDDGLEQGFNHAHVGFSEKEAQELLLKFTYKFPTIIKRMQKMAEIQLSEEEKMEFATEAGNLRFTSGMNNPELLLQPCRKYDHGNDLWSVFNVIQENCMKGGFQVSYRRARPITAIEANRKIMSGLYDIANTIYKRYYVN